MFFEGGVAEAVAASRQEVKPLVVLLTGFDNGSRQVQDALIEQEGSDWARGSIVLALEDDLGNADREAFADAKGFRAFCPVEVLPTVVMVSPSGATLAKLEGELPAAELAARLAEAYAAFRERQQRVLAAQAALLAASAGATPAAQPAAAAAAATAAQPAGDLSDLPLLEGEEEEQGRPSDDSGAAAAADVAAVFALRFKFTDTSTLKADFTGGTPLSEVFEAVDAARAAAGRPALPYVLVQAAPRRVLGAAHEGQSLAEAGVQPRTTLQVIPHAADGHRPPAPPDPEPAPAAVEQAAGGAVPVAAEPAEQQPSAEQHQAQQAQQPSAQQQEQAKVQQRQQAEVEQQQQAPPALPADVQLAVRLSNGASLRGSFQPSAPLAAVLDWIDAERSDSGAYNLSQPYPKRTFHSEDLGHSLQELGFEGRTALQLDLLPPRATPAAQRPLPAAAAAPSSQPPASLQLRVRLSDGASLQRTFPAATKLAAVFDWIDAARTDSGAYNLSLLHPAKRTFFSGDLGLTLQELGFDAQASLQLELLPSRPKLAAAAPAAAAPAAVAAVVHKAAPTAPPAGQYSLQFKLLNGEQLRGSFPPEATLQQVCHYLDVNRTDGGAPYVLVQPYPKRRFGPADMPQTLHSLGFESRQLLLLEPQGGSGGGRGGGWSLRGALSTAASYLNPYSYWGTGAAGTPREEHAVVQQDAVNDASAAAAGLSAPAGEAGGTASQRGARKRALGSGAGASNIHTLGSASAGAEDGDDSNQYWNGNSTEFGAGPPPDEQ